jgi:SAM-dependent methyltransferase
MRMKRFLRSLSGVSDVFAALRNSFRAAAPKLTFGYYAESVEHEAGRLGSFVVGEDANQYRSRLIAEIIAADPDTREAYRQIQSAIAALPDAAERAHAPLHEVRYLMTYSITPNGPGLLVDIGSSPIYAVPLTTLKKWTLQPIPVLAFDYEKENLPFPTGSTDGVLICEVIEHFVLDPLHCLIEINRILKDDGFIVLTTPNAASWYAVHQALLQRHSSRWPVYAWNRPNSVNHIHAREYVASEVRALLDAAGFGDIELTTRDYGISPPYRPIPGFSCLDRGETIFVRARKKSLPKKRSYPPLYLDDVAFEGFQLDQPRQIGLSASQNIQQREILTTLSLLTPCSVRRFPKVRIGAAHDGGYIMLDDLDGIESCVSLGIGTDVSWDLAMANRGCKIFQYDDSVDQLPTDHSNFTFNKLRVGANDSPGVISIGMITSQVRKRFQSSILKIDIEGSEWEVLDATSSQDLGCFSQIVCEFHSMLNLLDSSWAARARRIFEKLCATHFSIHVHGNNYAGFIVAHGIPIPTVLEVTFVSRARYQQKECEQLYPTSLDQPNDPSGPDLFLGNFRFFERR